MSLGMSVESADSLIPNRECEHNNHPEDTFRDPVPYLRLGEEGDSVT